MKKILILMLGLVASTASFATPSATRPAVSATHLVMTTQHKIKLYVQPLRAKGELSIWDADGRVIYTTTVSLQKGLNQQFDVSNLGTGTYRLSLTTDQEILTKSFVVQADPNASFVVQES